MLNTRLPLSSTKFIEKFYTLVENLREIHQNDIRILHQRIENLQKENEQLRKNDQQHSHAIFDIDYNPVESTIVEQLRTELQRTREQVNLLQESLNEQYLSYEDMKSKYNLQRMMNDNPSDQSINSTKFEGKIQRIKEQIHHFDQCHYESEEQLRLLKEILLQNDFESINQSLTVKQTDLSQQTDIIEDILNKQEEKILEKLSELFATTNSKKRLKRKRL